MNLEKLLRKAQTHREKAKHHKAMLLAKQACDLASQDPRSWLALGLSAEALELFETAGDAFYRAGDLYAQAQRHGLAQQWLQRALKLQPDHDRASELLPEVIGRSSGTVRVATVAKGSNAINLPPPRVRRFPRASTPLDEWMIEAEHEPKGRDDDESEAALVMAAPPLTREFTRATAIANVVLDSPALQTLRSDELMSLAKKAELVSIAAGNVVYDVGFKPRDLYLVCSGSVVAAGETIGVGGICGAEGLISDAPRTHAAATAEAAELLVFGVQEIQRLMDTNHQFEAAVLAELAPPFARSWLAEQDLAAHCEPSALEELSSEARIGRVCADDLLFQVGKPADSLCFLIDSGDIIGAVSVASGGAMDRTVRAPNDGWMLWVPASTARRLFAMHPVMLDAMTRY